MANSRWAAAAARRRARASEGVIVSVVTIMERDDGRSDERPRREWMRWFDGVAGDECEMLMLGNRRPRDCWTAMGPGHRRGHDRSSFHTHPSSANSPQVRNLPLGRAVASRLDHDNADAKPTLPADSKRDCPDLITSRSYSMHLTFV